jgi:hypothetical protein
MKLLGYWWVTFLMLYKYNHGCVYVYVYYLGKSAVGGIKSIWKVGRWPKIFGLKIEKSLENIRFEIGKILGIEWGFLGI